jgi:hypothetical protein
MVYKKDREDFGQIRKGAVNSVSNNLIFFNYSTLIKLN